MAPLDVGPPDTWPPLARAILVTLGGGSGLVLVGKLLDVLFPPAARRLDAERDREAAQNTRHATDLSRLDRLQAAIDKLHDEVQERDDRLDLIREEKAALREQLATVRVTLSTTTAQLEELRAKLGMPHVVLPENIPPEPDPPAFDNRPSVPGTGGALP